MNSAFYEFINFKFLKKATNQPEFTRIGSSKYSAFYRHLYSLVKKIRFR
ncbi:hypothetical protein D1AOALGA4SA_12123 [Olavius algarvensis Delta 1 endosymbiont]|nr:hypothetical protein D1AOALGA4SA_12123 [Olavius algarvensis Delta 1 endosymbiont]